MMRNSQHAGQNEHLHGEFVLQRDAGYAFYSPLRPPCSIYVLLEGRVSLTRLTHEGKRLVTDVLETGDVFGDLSFCGTANDSESAEAITKCRTLVVNSRQIEALVAAYPDLAVRMLMAMSRRLKGAQERLGEFAYSPMETRVASAVLRAAGQNGRTASVSHQFLAEMAGTHRETATHLLHELREKGLLQLGRCSIDIRDSQGLAALASG